MGMVTVFLLVVLNIDVGQQVPGTDGASGDAGHDGVLSNKCSRRCYECTPESAYRGMRTPFYGDRRRGERKDGEESCKGSSCKTHWRE
ncbi:hypothetical protein DFH07DRAFT_813047 [Mycena maculata]|uniref:Secreted protein n=1 Tax=Mycena maculata TaxID=230809 RepID=A0AAD7NJ11_9AGAR|nr:hypothetical protein DFH07DRAFT_813047 [Mycena maculata]